MTYDPNEPRIALCLRIHRTLWQAIVFALMAAAVLCTYIGGDQILHGKGDLAPLWLSAAAALCVLTAVAGYHMDNATTHYEHRLRQHPPR